MAFVVFLSNVIINILDPLTSTHLFLLLIFQQLFLMKLRVYVIYLISNCQVCQFILEGGSMCSNIGLSRAKCQVPNVKCTDQICIECKLELEYCVLLYNIICCSYFKDCVWKGNKPQLQKHVDCTQLTPNQIFIHK